MGAHRQQPEIACSNFLALQIMTPFSQTLHSNKGQPYNRLPKSNGYCPPILGGNGALQKGIFIGSSQGQGALS